MGAESVSLMPEFHRTRALVVATLPAAFLLLAPRAFATGELTRGEYVERVEPICKSETLANRTELKGVEGMVRRGKLRQAAPHVLSAAAALRGAIARISPVPRPPADAARLGRWLGFARAGHDLLQRLGVALRKGDRASAQLLARQLLRNTKRGNATVVTFDFDYCRVNPARFV